jgi:uncharacterized protein (TIGR03067 family)
MKPHLFLVVTVGLLIAREARADDAANKDTAKLLGSWKLMRWEENGEQKKPTKTDRVIIAAHNVNWFGHEMNYRLDPTEKPKAFDIGFGVREVVAWCAEGIYLLEADTLTICFGLGGPRPTEFTAKKGSRQALLVFHRQKPEADAIAVEIKKFEGNWTVVSAEYKGTKCVIAGDKVTVQVPVEGRLEKGLLRMKIDPTRKPKAIDLWVVQPGQTDEEVAKQNGALGIYELEGDTLKVCAAPVEKGRPTEFAAGAWTDRTVIVLKREKPKEARADAVKEQMKNLNGTWVVESVVRDPGEKAEGEGKGLQVIISGANVVAKAQGDGKTLGKATIRIDPTKRPKAIDITGEGGKEVVRGIYGLEGDTLKVCVGPTEKTGRPTEFAAKPGSRQTLVVFKRATR